MLQAAVISLGLIGAGTNNARIAGLLRNLSSYYYRDTSLLFCVRFTKIILVFLFPRGLLANKEKCFRNHLFCFTPFAGADCPRSCTFGEGLVNT